jgi:hypothetical protein
LHQDAREGVKFTPPKQLTPVKMKNTVESEARRKVGWDMANNSAVDLGVQELFLNSRQWPAIKRRLTHGNPNDAARECGLTAPFGVGSGELLGDICIESIRPLEF